MIQLRRFALPKTWFDAPRLAAGPVALILGLILSHALLLLTNQPQDYWYDPARVNLNFAPRALLTGGPLVFGGLVLAYLAIIALLLRRLRQQAGLALAGALFAFHMFSCIDLLGDYGISPRLHKGPVSDLVILIVIFFAVLIVILAEIAYRAALGSNQDGRMPVRLERTLARLAWGLGAGWLALLAVSLLWPLSGILVSSAWQPLPAAVLPPPRYYSAVAYDSNRRVAVLFGGMGADGKGGYAALGDTWEWDGETWTQKHSHLSPAPREGHVMVYDQERQVVLLFSGKNNNGVLGDLWKWDGQQWHKLCPVCNPAGRTGFGMVFDERLKKPLIFGGFSNDQDKNTWYDDAWSWDGTAWCFEPIDSAAPAASGFSMVYDSANQRIVAFTGTEEVGGTWIWKDRIWTRLTTPDQPPPLYEASLVYDPLNQRVVLMAGSTSRTFFRNDTWVLENDTWRKVRDFSPPAARSGQVAFYDENRHSIVMFGGRNAAAALGDLWEWKLPGKLPGETP